MRALALALAAGCGLAAAEDAAGIMRRMAENVERGAEERSRWIYTQRVRSALVYSDGKMARRERRVYAVTPGKERTRKEMVEFEGEYREHGRMVAYDKPGFERKKVDIDANLINDLTDHFVNEPGTRDGIPHKFFPFRASELDKYRFRLIGEGEHDGRRIWKIAFEPDGKATVWKGETWVDAGEFQPARVTTDLAFRIPWAVRAFLGTNVRQVGFSATYQRVAANVWFPITFGTEFRINVLFGYKRTITLALESEGFRRGEAESQITYDLVP